MKRQTAIELLRAALAGRGEVSLALLFGSTARDEAQSGSDVDLAVDAPRVDRLGLACELSAALGRECQVIDLGSATLPLARELIRDAVVVHEGRPGESARWRSRTLATLETDGPAYDRMADAYLLRRAERSGG